MWDLEYALLFGVPSNKVELIDGRSRWAFPFTSRELAEAHFSLWLETLARWKGVKPDAVRLKKAAKSWKAGVNRVRMELFPRPIEFRFPIHWKAFDRFYHTYWMPEFWPGEQPALTSGLIALLDHQDVRMNLGRLFDTLCAQHGGSSFGCVDIALSDKAAVCPDEYCYLKPRQECMIEGDYFCGVPNLIAEVLSPASRALDRGPRMELYRRTGVPHLWLVDPDLETVETYQLVRRDYELQGTFGIKDEMEIAIFPGETVRVEELFHTQNKRRGERPPRPVPKPIPEWLISPKITLGLEYFFLLGHPERRWEIWANKAPSFLAFGSPTEAKIRLAHFIEEACRWEDSPLVSPASLDAEVEQAEIGRFKFTRSGRLLQLDVIVDARKHRDLLKIWGRRDVWDWGED